MARYDCNRSAAIYLRVATNVLSLDGVSWLLGLLQGGLGLTGYDAVAHMIEELVRLHQDSTSAKTF